MEVTTLSTINTFRGLLPVVLVMVLSACQTSTEQASSFTEAKPQVPVHRQTPVSIVFRPELEQSLEKNSFGAEDDNYEAWPEQYRITIAIENIGQLQATNLDAQLDPVLRELANWAVVRQVTVIGHSDSEGSELSNMLLSIRRANAVADRLEDLGVEAGLLVVEAFGEEQPIGDNTSLEGRIANRRVEIVVTGYPQSKSYLQVTGFRQLDQAQLAARDEP